MIRIAAVDDEIHVLERFQRIVQNVEQIELCGLFETGEQLLFYLKENQLDAVFVDIEMPDINGLLLAQKILDLNENTEIIFLTAFNQYAVEAFELNAVDYIMKPMSEKRFDKTLSRLLKIKNIEKLQVKPFVQCIGDFEVFVRGQALTWKNSKAKEILAFLVYKKGVPVNWEKIADAVWPDYDSEKAQTNLHANTYLLRKRLADVGISRILESVRGNYKLVTGQFDCDIYQLEDLIKNNHVKRREDFSLIKQLEQNGYMEGNGYTWAYPKAAELYQMCKSLIEDSKIINEK